MSGLIARALAVALSPGMVTSPDAFMTKKQKPKGKRSKKSRKAGAVTKELEKQDKKLLALRLKLRRPREELVSQGIMPPYKSSPGFHEQRQKLERAKVGDSLQRKIRLRPEKSHLVNQHILADTHVDPLVNATQQRLKRSRLEQDLDSKIKNRPGPLELIEGNILKAEHLVEQAVKDGKVKFLKTNSLQGSPFDFDEDSQEGFSDEALSPSQSEVSQAESQLSTGSLPSAHCSSSSFSEHSKTLQAQQQQLQQQLQQQQQQQQQQKQQQRSSVTSPSQLVSPKSGQTFIAIKQEPGLVSPPPVSSNTSSSSSFTPISAVSSISLSSGGKVTPSPRQPRKKQTKRPKPKEIKFHEYKPPNEQAGRLPPSASTVSNPYNLLLMQQQLYLQLQLLQQQQLILPNTASSAKHKSAVSASASAAAVSSTLSTSGVAAGSTATAMATTAPTAVSTAPAMPPAPTKPQADIKPNIAAAAATAASATTVSAKPRSLSNLEDMKVSELKLELKNRGLHVSGTKPQLVERLRPYVLDQGSSSLGSPADVTTTTTTSSSSSSSSSTSSLSSPAVIMSSTKVSSSTDPDAALGEAVSGPSSLSTPPISPEYRSSLSVASEPMSPGSAFDPMSPPTFQGVLTTSAATPICSPEAVSTTNQPAVAGGQEPGPFDQPMPTLNSPQSLGPASVSGILPMDTHDGASSSSNGAGSSNTAQDSMMDVSSVVDPGNSGDLLRQQQLKIQELERMLQLSQMQLQMQQMQQQPTLSPLSAPQQQQQQQQQSPVGKQGAMPLDSPQQESKPAGFMFHSKDYAHTLNQQPKVFSFATPPPNGQPFLFTKQHQQQQQQQASPSEAQPLALPNGVVAGPKASSLPSSPTEQTVLGLGAGMTRSVTQPTFANPPPNYEEAVRQVKERKSQGNSPVSGSPVGSPPKGSDLRTTKCQDLDDLLEVLVDHGYQIPNTPKFQDIQRSLQQSSSSGGLASVTQSIVPGRGGAADLKLPAPGPSPPPPPATATAASHPYPPADLPMEVDPTDLNLSSLDLGSSGRAVGTGASSERACRTQSVPFDITMASADGEAEAAAAAASSSSASSAALGKDSLAPAQGQVQPSDSDLNWLDLVIPSSAAAGLTPASATPPAFGVDGAFGAALGKDPFPLNLLDLNDISTPTDLHHLEDDVWDNIPILE